MLDLIVVDGRARGIVVRDLVTGEITTDFADAVVLATGGYGNVFYLSTNAKGCNVTAIWRAHRKGALLRQPLLHADPPDLHPGLRRPPVEADPDERVAAQRRPGLGAEGQGRRPRARSDIPEDERDYYLERIYPSFGNLVPRDIASRAAKNVCDEGRGVGPGGLGVYLDFADAIDRLGREAVEAKYGNLFEMYERITGEDPYEVPMRIYPAVHYTMGGLWVDYDLQSTIPGLFVIGEANFSDHGANRLGASRADAGPGRRLLRAAQHHRRLPGRRPVRARSTPSHPAVGRGARPRSRTGSQRLLAVNGDRTVDSFHRELGQHHVGVLRHGAHRRGPAQGDRPRSAALREEFWQRVKVPGDGEELNQSLEKAGRVADFFELAELMCIDALHRDGVLRRPLPRRAARPRTARRSATTSTSPTSRPGSSPAPASRRSCTRKT